MHGRDWHDHAKQKEFEPEGMAGADALPDVESSGQRSGMGRRATQKVVAHGRVRRKRTTPPGKGPKVKPGSAKKISQSGAKGRGRV